MKRKIALFLICLLLFNTCSMAFAEETGTQEITDETEITEDVWAQIFELGRIHKVLPLIFDSAYRTLEESGRDSSAIRKLSTSSDSAT